MPSRHHAEQVHKEPIVVELCSLSGGSTTVDELKSQFYSREWERKKLETVTESIDRMQAAALGHSLGRIDVGQGTWDVGKIAARSESRRSD